MFRSRQVVTSASNFLQRQQRFGSNPLNVLLAAKEDKKQLLLVNQTILSGHNSHHQIGVGSSKMFLLMEQQKKRFFASSSDHGQQQQQKFGRTSYEEFKEKRAADDLDEKTFQLNSTDVLRLQVRRGLTRPLFFSLVKSFGWMEIRMNFVPEEAYQLVRAMDAMLNTLMAKHEQINNSSEPGRPVVLESQRICSDLFDLQLELVWLGNAYEFKMTIIKKSANDRHKKGKELRLPVRALPWLRQTLAQALVEHDAGNSQQQLGPAPPELPQSILQAID